MKSRTWKVLFVKPRTEKKVQDYCRIYNITAYVPLRVKERRVQRRKVQFHVPIFPGYVFVRVNADERLKLLQTNCVVRVLEPLKPRAMIHSLIMVRRALRAEPTLEAIPALTAGKKIRITSGPFMGVEGKIERMRGNVRVVINIDVIAQAVEVTVDAKDVELIES